MKDSDLQNARRILHLIRLLTAEELDSVEVHSDNADFNGQPDCSIYCRRWVGNDLSESHFRADTLLDCLLQAMSARGLIEVGDWGGDSSTIVPNLVAAVEQAKADVGLQLEPGPVTVAAVQALEMWARCYAASEGKFNGGATTRFKVRDVEFELTIKPKREGFSFIETADTIERDRSSETPAEDAGKLTQEEVDYFMDPDGDDGT